METRRNGPLFLDARLVLEELAPRIDNATSLISALADSVTLVQRDLERAEATLTSKLNGVMSLYTVLQMTQRVTPDVVSESRFVVARPAYDFLGSS